MSTATITPNSPTLPSAVDEQFLTFLLERLSEEITAATHRRQTASAPSLDAAERGLRILDELVLGLKCGQAPDQMSLGMLTVAYGKHPDFLPQWNRWTP